MTGNAAPQIKDSPNNAVNSKPQKHSPDPIRMSLQLL